MMAMLARVRELPAKAGRGAVALWLVLGFAACSTTPTGDGSPFVLTTRGDFVRSNAPPGIELTLGSKLIRPADAPGRPD